MAAKLFRCTFNAKKASHKLERKPIKLTDMHTGYFITGTDTGVGKTLVTCTLLHAFAQQGKQVVGMKPVAAGCELATDGMECEDVTQLQAHSNVTAPLALVNPYAFAPPVAPNIAAEQSEVEIDLEHILANFNALQTMADVVLVEGVGGFMVPLNANQTTADLSVKLALPVIMVVGMRLGCINHALLTAQAIAHAELHLAGWVANQIDPAMQAVASNLHTLQARIDAPLLGVVPYCEQHAPAQISHFLDITHLHHSNYSPE